MDRIGLAKPNRRRRSRANRRWSCPKSIGLDPLTQLPNRAQLQERFAHAIASAQRHRTRVAVLFADIDGFKGISRPCKTPHPA
ncbi:MAG: diguanylate cyclase [Simplicispira sp.]|nr:diguanylate cyclase [Simplicispira sp.]